MKNESMNNNSTDFKRINEDFANEKVDLPIIEFGANEESIEKSIVDAIEQLPLDEQESYWQVMDNEALNINDKLNLVNDMLKKYNGDIQE